MIRDKAVHSARYTVHSAERRSRKHRALGTVNRALVGLGMVVGMSGCTDFAGYDLDYFWGYIPALTMMRSSLIYDPYAMPRLPAEHSIPVESPMGDIPPHFSQAALDSAAATLTNPYAGGASPAVLARGEQQYLNQCSACHGPDGAGTGPVVGAGKFPFAPAINGSVTAVRSDGYLYGVIVAGRGLMPAYGERLNESDRWAIVSYVRGLQGAAGASPAATPAPAAGTPATPAAPAPVAADTTGPS